MQFKFVEDIILGTKSMKEDGGWDNYLKDKVRSTCRIGTLLL